MESLLFFYYSGFIISKFKDKLYNDKELFRKNDLMCKEVINPNFDSKCVLTSDKKKIDIS